MMMVGERDIMEWDIPAILWLIHYARELDKSHRD
jgi:hypothetical protein